jgi:sulfide:quinone oxidoreductase
MAVPTRIVIVGSSFAGYTALKLARELKAGTRNARAEITVIYDTDIFTFIISLIWLPFEVRSRGEITFPLRPPLEKAAVGLVHVAASRIALDAQQVITPKRSFAYNYLAIGTGPKVFFDAIPGLGPSRNGTIGYTYSICNLDHAEQARDAWDEFLKDPGPVVVGAVQGASCFGAVYEFVLNLAYQIKKHGLKDRVPITFFTAEPYLGHFGIGHFGAAQKLAEMFFAKMGIEWRVSQVIDHIEDRQIVLVDGERLPFRFAMLIPPFRGVDAVTRSPGLGNATGSSKWRTPIGTACTPGSSPPGLPSPCRRRRRRRCPAESPRPAISPRRWPRWRPTTSPRRFSTEPRFTSPSPASTPSASLMPATRG